jgi:rhodanese-related sulfurtransferase
MKINLKSVLLWVGMSLIISGPCALAHTDVTAEKARELIDSTDDLIVIDVREPSEYSDTGGHIPGALNYPLYSGVLLTRYEELPMDGPVLVVCGSGSRSHQAAKFLDSKDFSMVYDMQAGMIAWIWETETGVDTNIKYGGGTGEPNDPYQIATAEDLMLLGESPEDYDKHFILTADIDLDPDLPGRKVFDKAVIAPDTDTDPNTWSDPFTGVFDGKGHNISNLTIEGGSHLGLFGRLRFGGELTNLGVVDVKIASSDNCVGGLVGDNYDGHVSRCYSTGVIRGDDSVGGLAGANARGNVTQCYSTTVATGHDRVGGLVGDNRGHLTNCFGSGAVSGNHSVGGLVGCNSRSSRSRGYIANSYSTGAVSGGSEVGGLVGRNGSNPGVVTACYSTGPVSGGSGVGGLVGENAPPYAAGAVTVACCYSTGMVSGKVNVGGLLGYNSGGTTASFWDMQTSGQTISSGGTGKTTAEMQTASTFLDAGWDFVDETENGTEDIWSICEGTNYPRLVWQIPVGDFVCSDGITIDDFLFFMEHWLDDNCDSSNDYCEGTDLDQSGTVDVNDLEIFFENWSAEQ